ncbi:unnamed protein product [Rotaria sp. Silwood1]|nr:unnamed protein product [Rotaria sp. Silwood1]CAF4751876.1 unnamed protein product [Rotaria sp. Silwood1]
MNTQVKGLNHIHPAEIRNPDLKKVTTTPFARSETRCITPVTVNFKDVGGYDDRIFVLCDSPGFEDTSGSEVDIANGVGIVQAIKGCKSVKLVVVLSYKSLGDRLNGLKVITHTLVDPINDDPVEFLNQFLDSDAIHHPDEVFQFSITEKSRATVHEQVRRHQLSILSATNRFDYLLVKYKLDQLKHLNDLIDQEYIKQIYTDCIQNISKHLSEEYEEGVSFMNRCLMNQTILSNEDVRQYQSYIDHAKLADELRQTHLGKEVVDSTAFIQYVNQQVEIMLIELREKEINDSLVRIILDKIKLVSTLITDIDQEKYKQICQIFAEKFESVINSFKSSVLSNKFDQCISDITKLHEALTVLQDHLNYEDMKTKYVQMKEYFLKYLNDSVRKLNHMFNQEKLHKNDIESLNNCVCMLETVKNIITFQLHISKEAIDDIYEDLLSKILNYFEEIIKKINSELNNENAFHILEIFLIELDSIRMISIIEFKTTRSYYRILEKIIEYLRQSKRDAEQLLTNLFRPEGKVNYNQLKKCLMSLKSAQWIEKYRAGAYTDVMSDVEEKFIENMKQMKVSLMEMTLDLDSYNKIDSAYKIVSEMKEMKDFEEIFTDVNQYLVEVHSWFENTIYNVCNIIKDSFSLEKLKEQEHQSLDFNKAEKAFHYLDACKKIRILSKNYYMSVMKSLEECIRYYISFVQNEMQSCFENIKQFQSTHKEEMLEKVRTLSTFLQEVHEIKTTYSCVFSCFLNGKIFEQWQQELSNYRMELVNEMETLCIIDQTAALKNKLLIAKALSRLDSFLEGEKYIDVYIRYQNEFLSKMNNASGKIRDAIQKYDYEQVARELIKFKSLGDVGEDLFKQAKQALNRSLDLFMEETKYQAIMLGNNLEIEKIKLLVDNLNRIQKAKQYVSQYLDTPDELDKCVADVKIMIEERLKRFLQRVQAFIYVNNFYEVEQKKEYINLVHHLLGSYCTKVISDEIKRIQERQNHVILVEVVQKYFDMDIDMYVLNSPTDIFEKFEAVKNINPIYNQALNKIKENIVSKFRKELELAKLSMPPNPNNIHIRKFESAVKCLPEAMRSALESDLKYCKKDINSMIQNNHKELQNLNSSEDSKTIKNPRQYQSSQNMQSLISQTRELVLIQVQEIADQINQNFEQHDVTEALTIVKILYEYKNELDTIVTHVRQPYSTVQSQIKIKFENAYICFMNQFLQNNTFEITNELVETIEKSFLCLIEFIKFKNKFKDQPILTHTLPEDFNEKLIVLNRKTTDYFTILQKKYEDALEKFDISSLKETLDFMHKWNSLIMKMKNDVRMYNINDTLVNSMMKAIIALTIYPHMLHCVSQKFQELQDEIIHQQLINKETTESSQQREKFYRKLNEKFLILDKIKLLSKHELNIDVNTAKQEFLKSLETKITEIFNSTQTFLRKFSKESELTSQNCHNFNLYYGNLLSYRREMKGMNFRINEQIDKIEKIIFDKIYTWVCIVEIDSSVSNISLSLINMKRVSNNIPLFKFKINRILEQALNQYKNRTKGTMNFSKLGAILNQDVSGIGQSIVDEIKTFQGYTLSLFNEKTQRYDINYVLKNLKGDFIEIDQLTKRYREFQNIYDSLIKKYFKIDIDLQKVIANTKLIAVNIKQTSDVNKWDSHVRDGIPMLLAHIFALWTFQNANYYFKAGDVTNPNNYILKPHAAQIVSILRMLGIGDNKEELRNNLVQIDTGEGKSVVLGVIATTFALLGFDVSCVCYSEYLSQKDYIRFLPIFDSLDLLQYIHYGTINKLCEDIISQNSDIRHIVEQLISIGFNRIARNSQSNERAKILLIDEVDVFFSRDFYGNVYIPSANLRDPTITSLINFIWSQRKSNLKLNQVEATAEYKACCHTFPTWEPLIREAVKDIIDDVHNFESYDYVVKEDKIGYIEQDNIVYNVVYSYKTLFAYYYEHEKGQISRKSLEEKISIRIKCGSFSYAEIPLQFKYIMGVTGTLETLSDPEKQIIQNVYKIGKNTYIPSMFGKKNLMFRIEDDIIIENSNDYFNTIKREIDNRLVGKSSEKRAILVFFESKQRLKEFYESKALETIKQSVAYLTEEASSEEKEIAIKRATASGQITLFTRTFGRGTDFICYDPSVTANGGTHVIQTFFSEHLSEEQQIKSRTTRQGDYGSYSMVLLDDDLEKFLIQKEDIENVKKGRGIQVCLPEQPLFSTIYFQAIFSISKFSTEK